MKNKKWKVGDTAYYIYKEYEVVEVLSEGKVRLKSVSEGSHVIDVYSILLNRLGKKPTHIFKIGDPVYYRAKMYFVSDMKDGNVIEIANGVEQLGDSNSPIGNFTFRELTIFRIFPVTYETYGAMTMYSNVMRKLLTPEYRKCVELIEDGQIRHILIGLWEKYCTILCYEPYSDQEGEKLKSVSDEIQELLERIQKCVESISQAVETAGTVNGKSIVAKYIKYLKEE
jgi:hypothetical protein